MHETYDIQDRYRLLIDAITDYAIYMLDPSGVVTSWNPGAQRFKGYAASEIIGQHFSVFYTPEEKSAGVPAFALQMAATQGRFEREGWRVRKDGTQFWAHVVLDPIRTPEGELVGYAKITRDLTERRAAEQALRASEEQFRLLVQGVTDYAIYLLDREGRVSSWNAGAQRIKGYRPEEIIGHHFSTFYSETDRTAGVPFRGLATAASEGRWEQEGWRIRKDGSQFWAHVVIDAIHDDNGVLIGFAKITRDVTERMESQRALEQTREALLQSQKMEAIGQLTGGMAHDFNNLLTAITGSLELLRKRLPFDPKISPLIDIAMQGAERGSMLTQRMLAFARRQDLALQPVDASALVRSMSNFLQRSIGASIRIDARFPVGLPLVSTDPAQLEAAILNLAINARDAISGPGVITIAGRTERASEGSPLLAAGDYVVISVRDTGCGMDEKTLARAAEPFFTTKDVGKGTGLGLSMVHGLAAQSGGRVNITSVVGEGTEVEIWLPCVSGQPASIAPASFGQRTILVVDDDALVLANTTALLEDLDYRVIPAASPAEALDVVEQAADLDLLVTDEVMPQMSGLDLIEEVRRLRPGLPVLLVTGYSERMQRGDVDVRWLSKPFTQSQLGEAAEELMKGA